MTANRHWEGRWVAWTEGKEYAFADLLAAYVEWQKTVKSPVAATPTPAGSLGQVLSRAGFQERRTVTARFRKLPNPEKCLETLWNKS